MEVGVSAGLKLIKSLSCIATECLDRRQVLCSIDTKPLCMVWRRMVGSLQCMYRKYIEFLAGQFSEESPKPVTSPFLSMILRSVLISCFFLLGILGGFSPCVNSAQMLWERSFCFCFSLIEALCSLSPHAINEST